MVIVNSGRAAWNRKPVIKTYRSQAEARVNNQVTYHVVGDAIKNNTSINNFLF